MSHESSRISSQVCRRRIRLGTSSQQVLLWPVSKLPWTEAARQLVSPERLPTLRPHCIFLFSRSQNLLGSTIPNRPYKDTFSVNFFHGHGKSFTAKHKNSFPSSHTLPPASLPARTYTTYVLWALGFSFFFVLLERIPHHAAAASFGPTAS